MEPQISNISEDDGLLKFTVTNVNVSVANSIRRCVISEIPTYGFRSVSHKENDIHISKNTTRLNNEIIKQRVGCIPIHNIHKIENHKELHKILQFEISKKNNSKNIEYLTTEDFKIKNTSTDKYLSDDDRKKIFPPNSITGDYIIICRLRPKISEDIDGETLEFKATISLNTGNTNYMYNASCTNFYNFTPDKVEQNKEWASYSKKLKKDDKTSVNMENEKKNWYLHNGLRQYVENSFDFTLETVGVYTNVELLKKACDVMVKKLENCSSKLDDDTFKIEKSKTTMENSFDIILMNEDYTLGKVIEYFMYNHYFEQNQILSYIGFRKNHPHDNFSILRLAFKKPINNISIIKEYIKNMNSNAVATYKKIKELFYSA